MSLVIRMAKTGRKNEKKFKVVVKEKRSRRDGDFVDALGFVEKTKEKISKDIDLKKLASWLKKGAVVSEALKKIL